ncbi:MAG: hypothetical protein V7637_3295 [Mycobacteriales bacterium]|jgi:hypothetical protein
MDMDMDMPGMPPTPRRPIFGVTPLDIDEVALDDVGSLIITDRMRNSVVEKTTAELRAAWPAASPTQIGAALEQLVPFRINTLTTGRINYAEADGVSLRILTILTGPSDLGELA